MAGTRKDYYRILQVDALADPAVIQGAYRALLKSARLHPDLGGSEGAAQEINEAYGVLGDAAQRKAYDRTYKAPAETPATHVVAVPRYILICPGCGARNLLQHTEDLAHFRCAKCSRLLTPRGRLSDPADIRRSLRLGLYLFERRMYDRARRELEAVVRAAPRNATHHYWLGRTYFQKRMLEKARGEFVSAGRLSEGRFHFEFWAGVANLALCDFPAAAAAFARAARLRPGHLPTLLRLATCYAHLREFAKAAEAMRLAVTRHGKRPEPHIRLGLYLLAGGDAQAAAAAFRQARAIAPDHPLVRKYLSLMD
ncbi:MAG: tetratricopeptide repeat protein [Candidatus Lambdaproteobacteria bacterium]|nr:tetratricopeptide repeat protein [Candidatus Lambdaproteobacteria bacterium]